MLKVYSDVKISPTVETSIISVYAADEKDNSSWVIGGSCQTSPMPSPKSNKSVIFTNNIAMIQKGPLPISKPHAFSDGAIDGDWSLNSSPTGSFCVQLSGSVSSTPPCSSEDLFHLRSMPSMPITIPKPASSKKQSRNKKYHYS